MPQLSKSEFARLVSEMPGASEDEIFAEASRREAAKEPGIFQKLTTPLTDLPSRAAKKVADWADTPELNDSRPEALLKGFTAGAIQGTGDLLTSFTSPADIAATLAGVGGAKAGARGLLGISKAARGLEAASMVPFAAEGARSVGEGIQEGNAGAMGAGALQLAMSLVGANNAAKHSFPPAKVRDAYMASKGREVTRGPKLDVLDEAQSMRTADAYAAMPHTPDDPRVAASYAAMADETSDQFKFLRDKAGVKMEPWTKEGQPYANSAEMMADIEKNNRLFYFPTEAGYGSGADVAVHPLLAQGKSGVPVNDEFRAAHDYFGHAVDQNQFGPLGEERAYRAHAEMFPDEARGALTSETRGQNSWVNYGPHLRRADGSIPKKGDPDFIRPQDRPFAEQKAGLLPEELIHRPGTDPALPKLPEGELPVSHQMEGAPPEFHSIENIPARKTGLKAATPDPVERIVEKLPTDQPLGSGSNRQLAEAMQKVEAAKASNKRGASTAMAVAAPAVATDPVLEATLDTLGIEDEETRESIKTGMRILAMGAGATALGAAAYRDMKSPVTLANTLATGRLATGKPPAYVAKLLRRAIPELKDKQILSAIKFGQKKALSLHEKTGGKIADVKAQKEIVLRGAQNKHWYEEGPMLIKELKEAGHITSPEDQRVWEGLIGAFGSQNPPKGNYRDAWQMFEAYKRGEVGFDPDGSFRLPYGWSAETPGVDNAARVLAGDEPGGRKINTYTHQLAGRKTNKAVLDRHEGRAHGFDESSRPGLGAIDNSAYEVMEQTKKQVAKELGWNTSQVQAASWAGSREAQAAKKLAEGKPWKKQQQGYPMLQQHKLREAEDRLIDQGLVKRTETKMNLGKKERALNPDAVETKLELTPAGKKVFEPAIKAVYDLTRKNGGASVNLKTGAFSDEPLSAVSLFPERTLTIPKGVQLTPNHVKGFIMDNLDLLENPNLAVGSWVNPKTGETVLDISATVSNEADNYLAKHLGQKYGQEAAFDFSTKAEISTGGTGRGTGDEPHLYQRLNDVTSENLSKLLSERRGVSSGSTSSKRPAKSHR
jgi:hypothetical protein